MRLNGLDKVGCLVFLSYNRRDEKAVYAKEECSERRESNGSG
jgi:hypothetical protein